MTFGSFSGRQLLLNFPRIDPADRPLIETEPYRAPLAALRRWRSWPESQLAIVGAPFAGKSRLLRLWAADAEAAFVTGEGLAQANIEEIANLTVSALVIDDADRCSEGRNLLAAINLCRERKAPILVSGRSEPAGWFAEPRDLCSRMQAMPAAMIGHPDEDSLTLRLIEECARRYLVLPEETARYLAQRMDWSWAGVSEVSDEIGRIPAGALGLRAARNVLISLGMDAG